MIIMGFLSRLMAGEGDINSKNPKTLSIIILWVPGHMRIPGNRIADKEANAALTDDLLVTEKYPPQD
jgi:ribonuclease HI